MHVMHFICLHSCAFNNPSARHQNPILQKRTLALRKVEFVLELRVTRQISDVHLSIRALFSSPH